MVEYNYSFPPVTMTIPMKEKWSKYGYVFTVGNKFAGVSTAQLLIQNPSSNARTLYIDSILVSGTDGADITMHFNPAVTTAGTALTPVSTNPASGASSNAHVEYGGTYDTTSATPLPPNILPGGQGNFAVGGTLATGDPLLLPPGTSLLITVTNSAGTTANYAITVTYLEK